MKLNKGRPWWHSSSSLPVSMSSSVSDTAMDMMMMEDVGMMRRIHVVTLCMYVASCDEVGGGGVG